MAAKRTYPPVMPHEERRKLIERPIVTRRIPSKSWGGVLITAPHIRSQHSYLDDESGLRYGRPDDPGQGD